MAEAFEAGVSPGVFWDLTYRELFAALTGYQARKKHDTRMAIVSGYYAGVVNRAKRPRKLDRLLEALDRPPPGEPMKPKAMRAAIIAANNALGGKIRYVPKGSIRGT